MPAVGTRRTTASFARSTAAETRPRGGSEGRGRAADEYGHRPHRSVRAVFMAPEKRDGDIARAVRERIERERQLPIILVIRILRLALLGEPSGVIVAAVVAGQTFGGADRRARPTHLGESTPDTGQ